MRREQKINTPTVAYCKCGAEPHVVSDDGDYSQRGGYGFMYRVECRKCWTVTKYCNSTHRAKCKWNNKQANLD